MPYRQKCVWRVQKVRSSWVQKVFKFFFKKLLHHVGANIKLLLPTVAMLFKPPVIWSDQLLCVFFHKLRRKVFQSVLLNVFCLLVTPTLAGQVKINWCNVGSVLSVLENLPLELFACPFASSSCTFIPPSSNHRDHLLTIPSFTAPSPDTSTVCL